MLRLEINYFYNGQEDNNKYICLDNANTLTSKHKLVNAKRWLKQTNTR